MLISLSACASSSANGDTQSAEKTPDYRPALNAYVRSTRGWKPDEYEIGYAIESDKMLRFFIVNLPANAAMPKNALGGDGASFYACIDPGTGGVVKEFPVE